MPSRCYVVLTWELWREYGDLATFFLVALVLRFLSESVIRSRYSSGARCVRRADSSSWMVLDSVGEGSAITLLLM